jgi:hypothetical protein
LSLTNRCEARCYWGLVVFADTDFVNQWGYHHEHMDGKRLRIVF